MAPIGFGASATASIRQYYERCTVCGGPSEQLVIGSSGSFGILISTVAEPRLALGWLAPIGRLVGHPRLGMAGVALAWPRTP